MEFLNEFATAMLPIVALFLMGIVPIAIGVIGHYVKKWTGARLSDIQRGQIEGLAYDAVSFAEEQAHKYLKSTGEKLPSDDKMKAAIDFIAKQAIELNLPGVAVTALRDLVEARLGEGRDNETD